MTALALARPVSTPRRRSRETALRMHLPPTKRTGPENTHAFVYELLGEDVHAMRVLSLANGVVGVMHAAALGIHAIGRGLADALDLDAKHAIKQVDRLLSNRGITIWLWFAQWVAFVVGARKEILVALDWTEFDKDGQATIALYLVTSHGRATPLVWKTIDKAKLKDRRGEYELDVVSRLHEILPRDVDVMVLADRGFGDQTFFAWLDTIGWGYVIRFRQIITIAMEGESKPARDWMPPSGHAKMLRDVRITHDKTPIAAVVLKHQKGMKEAWCLATNRAELGAAEIVARYARRFTIEETFRDIKDNHFGMGLSATHIGTPERRDRLLFISAVAQALLTLLGAAGEECGLDRTLKANTVARRTMSLFNQGSYWYRRIPNMGDERLGPLMTKFGDLLAHQPAFKQLCGVL
jgi:Transposase DDE domain